MEKRLRNTGTEEVIREKSWDVYADLEESVKMLSRFERNEGFPDLEKLKKIAEVLYVPLEVLCPVPCRECPYRKKVEA